MSHSRFQPGEGPSRVLLRDYEPSDGPSFEALYKAAQVNGRQLFDCEIISKKVPRPKHCKAKATIQRIQDLESGEL